jgi:hypothetical protein
MAWMRKQAEAHHDGQNWLVKPGETNEETLHLTHHDSILNDRITRNGQIMLSPFHDVIPNQTRHVILRLKRRNKSMTVHARGARAANGRFGHIMSAKKSVYAQEMDTSCHFFMVKK